MIITDSATLWCFAIRRSAKATPTDCVATLVKGVAKAGPASGASALGLACESRLAANVDKLTELAIIMLKEH